MAQFTGRKLDADAADKRREYLLRLLGQTKGRTRSKVVGTAPSEQLARSARTLAQCVRAHTEHSSNPRYLIVFVGIPAIPKPSSEDMRAIERTAVQYISVTGVMRDAPAEVLYQDVHGTVYIEKSDEYPYGVNALFLESDPRPPNAPQPQSGSPPGGADHGKMVD